MGRTCCVQKLLLTFRTIFVHTMFSPCSAKRRDSDKDLPVQSTRHAVTAAKKIGGDISCIVAGPKCAGPAAEVAKIEGISKVIVAENAAYEG